MILNKKHHVAITSSMKPLPLKNPCVLSLKCATLQSRAADPWARVGKGVVVRWVHRGYSGERIPFPLTSVNDSMCGQGSSLLCRGPTPHNKVSRIIHHFYLQRQNPHLMQWWMASLLSSTVLRCCRNNAAHFSEIPKRFAAIHWPSFRSSERYVSPEGWKLFCFTLQCYCLCGDDALSQGLDGKALNDFSTLTWAECNHSTRGQQALKEVTLTLQK